MNFDGSFPHSCQSIVTSSSDRLREAVETYTFILDFNPKDVLEINMYLHCGALGVDTRVANCLKADLNYVLVDTGMDWPRSLGRKNRDDARTKWYLVNCDLQ